MSDKEDQLGSVPKLAPARDEIASFQRSNARGSFATGLGEVPDVDGGSSSAVMKTLMALVVLVLLATAAMSGYLYQKLTFAETALRLSESRIGQLEQRLSVTDESMSESSDAIKEKTMEMDSEIRKLWDNVWKKSKKQFALYDKHLRQLDSKIAASDSFIVASRAQQTKTDKLFTDLDKELTLVKATQATVASNKKKLTRQESSLESANDKLNRIKAQNAKLDQRIKGTEEWVESINGFRRQVLRDIDGLKKSTAQLQASP